MEKLDEAKIVARFAACENKEDLRECESRFYKEDPVIAESTRRHKVYRAMAAQRRRQLLEAELAPFHDAAKQMQHVQKVYFGKSCLGGAINLRDPHQPLFRADKAFKAGDWPYVCQYQPRKKLLWLCRAKEKCAYGAVNEAPFSLSDIKKYEISRTELECRK